MNTKFYELIKQINMPAGKKLVGRSMLLLAALSLVIVSCKKQLCTTPGQQQSTGKVKPVYSNLADFGKGISNVTNLIRANHIVAYLDTLPSGYPDTRGRRVPLEQFGYAILEKLQGGPQQIESGVYDVFHFDGATFSLISFLMKAQMAGDISARTLADIIADIPLPPVAMDGFEPPVAQVAVDTPEYNSLPARCLYFEIVVYTYSLFLNY